MRRLVVVAAAILLAACESATPDSAARPRSAPPPGPTATITPVPTDRPPPTATPTPAPLADRLNDPDPSVRLAAIQEMAARPDDPVAVPALERAASDPDQLVVLAAIEGLGSLGGEEALRVLLGQVRTIPDEFDAMAVERTAAAVSALGEIGGRAAINRVLEIAAPNTAPYAVTWAATTVLDTLGPADVPTLARALNHRSVAVRVLAVERLAAIGGPDAVDRLIGQIDTRNAAVRRAAITALGELGARKATGALVEALNSKRTFDDAEAALARIHDADATSLLRYLRAARTVRAYAPIITIGQSGTERALVTALDRFGYKDMALDYLNCGNATLDRAARRWAERHGYIVYTIPGAGGGSVVWGG